MSRLRQRDFAKRADAPAELATPLLSTLLRRALFVLFIALWCYAGYYWFYS
jgi:hypothetical protein